MHLALCFLMGLAHAGVLSPAEIQKKLGAFEKLKELEVDFKQVKVLKDLDLTLPATGTLRIKRPDIWWILKDPAALTMHYSGNQMEIESGDGPSKTSRKIALGEIAGSSQNGVASLLPWLEFNFAEISKSYEVQEISKNEYLFLAKSKASAIPNLQMQVNKQGDIQVLVLKETSGDELKIEFKSPTKKCCVK